MPPGEEIRFVLKPGVNRIGAADGNDIVLRMTGVSKQHAILNWTPEGLELEDLGSKNGTFCNGREIGRAVIKTGDRLGFGTAVFILETVDSGDLSMAIRTNDGEMESRSPASAANPGGPHTTASLMVETVPAAWLDIPGGWAARPPQDWTGNAVTGLEDLRQALGAKAAVRLEWSISGDMCISELAGVLDSPAALELILDDLARVPELASMAAGETVHYLQAGDPPWILSAIRKDGSNFLTLALAGDFPYRSVARHLLRVLLQTESVCPSVPGAANPARAGLPESSWQYHPDFIPGESAAFQRVLEQLRGLLAGTLPVLITGETGTGKEQIARLLHASSDRCRGPLVAVNCAAIPADLMEAELFGIEKGVATGVESRTGKFQLAHGGILFLDEIGELPLSLQAKLLRAIQAQLIWPVGGRSGITVDVRIVSSTNRDLHQAMRDGQFRRDLYYRIAGGELHLPALRDRSGDIPLLAARFLHRFREESGRRPSGISTKALELLCAAAWPGNIRELENEIRRLVYICPDGQPIISTMLAPALQAASAPPRLSGAGGRVSGMDLDGQVRELERRLIVQALEQSAGNQSQAARLLGISRNGLLLKLKRMKC